MKQGILMGLIIGFLLNLLICETKKARERGCNQELKDTLITVSENYLLEQKSELNNIKTKEESDEEKKLYEYYLTPIYFRNK